MPNWCNNEVNINGSAKDIAALKELIGEDFDFNKIVPMPECLEADSHGQSACGIMVVCDSSTMLCHKASEEHGGRGLMKVVNAKCKGGGNGMITLAQAVIDGFKPCPECINTTTEHSKELGLGLDCSIEESIRRLQEYGHDNWYDWHIANWGTKWAASDADVEFTKTSMTARFDTAWSPPEPIYQALVDKFHDLEITWHWDEPGMDQSGDLDTGAVYDYQCDCDCDEEDCYYCHPENDE